MHKMGSQVLSFVLVLALSSVVRAGTEETVAVGEITGQVLMPDGSPAAGANILVMCIVETEGWAGASEPLCTLEAKAAEDGTFRLQPAPIAKEKLSGQRHLKLVIVAAHENAGFTGTSDERGGSQLSDPLNLLPLRLNAPSALTGTVTDAGGAPLVQATVILTGWEEFFGVVPELSPFRVKTQSDGTFTFQGVPREGRFSLLVQKEGYPDVHLWSAPNRVSIAVPKPASLTGRVVTAAGEPLAGCHVWYAAPMDQKWGEPGVWEGKKDVATGPDGRFTAALLFPTAYDLQVDPPAGAEDKWAPTLVPAQAVDTGETKDLGDVVLTAGGMLSGKVTDSETGKPIPDAGVSVKADESNSTVGQWFGKTDARGRYEFRLPAGRYEAYALLPGYGSPLYFGERPTLILKTGGRREQHFRLQRLFDVHGKLLLPDGSPAANCDVRAKSSWAEQFPRTDSSGWFRLYGLERGDKVTLRASDAEHGARLATSFTVSKDKAELTFTMEKAATCLVTGRVVDDEGKPVSGMQVSVVEAGNVAASGTTGADGRYSINVLRGSQGSVVLGKRGSYISDDLKLQFASERIEKGDMVAPRLDQEVAGVVVDIDGEPVPDAGVKGSGVTVQAYAWTRTGTDGRFRLERLPRGEIDVEAYKDIEQPDQSILSTHVSQRVPASTMDLRLVLPVKQKAATGAAQGR